MHLNNGRLRLRSITSCHTGYGALSHTEEGPCKVHKTGRQPSGRVPSLTGLLLVMSMKLGRLLRSQVWRSEIGLVPEGNTHGLQSASGVSLYVCSWISHRSKGSNCNSNFTSFIMRLCCVDKFAALLDVIQVFHGLYRWISIRDFSARKLRKCASRNYELLCILL